MTIITIRIIADSNFGIVIASVQNLGINAVTGKRGLGNLAPCDRNTCGKQENASHNNVMDSIKLEIHHGAGGIGCNSKKGHPTAKISWQSWRTNWS
jgi:hypothetical protein